MAGWINIVLPIGTLVLGSVLTMAGQALKDRRVDERERRARREEFLTGNFETHRSAMLEMQDLVRDLHAAYQAERQRRIDDGFYRYMKDFPIRDRVLKFFSGADSFMTDLDAIKNASSDAERNVLIEASTKNLKVAKEEAARTAGEMRNLGAVLETLNPFWEELAGFMPKLRLCMLRSGSNSVLYSGEELINAVFKWSEYFQLEGRQEDLREQVRVAYQTANRALSNALKFGPYDKYDAYKDSSAKASGSSESTDA